MGTNKKNNHASVMAADQSLIDGFLKHAATLVTLLVAGSTVKTSELVAVLQARIAAIKLALSTKAAFMAAVAAAHAEIANTAKLVSGARQALKVAFAGQVDTLADFGLKPPKPRTPLTAEQKAEAVAKAQATRKARHTMGAKEKAKITGVTAAAAAAVAAAAVPPPAPTQGQPVQAATPASPATPLTGGTSGASKS
jgi:hypothetical protein